MNSFEIARYNAGLSIREAAATAKISERTISRIESGEIEKPSAPIASALAAAYDITVGQLFGLQEAA